MSQSSQISAAAQNGARNGAISGRLTLPIGKPAVGRRVLAIVAAEGPVRSAVINLTHTDAQGRYLLDDVPPGRYIIATGSLDELTFFPGTADASQAAVVTVASGGKTADVDFQLATVRVSGRVLGVVPTELRFGTGARAPKAAVSRDGAFQFDAVPPGTYRLTTASAEIGVTSGEIVVAGDDVGGIQVGTARLMSFPVTVSVEGGGPTPSLQLRFEEVRGLSVPASLVVGGAAPAASDVSLPDLQFRLVLPEPPPGLVVKSATLVYPSGGTTSVLEKPFIVHQMARLEIVLGRAPAAGGSNR
jgi:hypothetical protein